MITVVDLSRSGSTAHNTVGDNQRAYVTTIVLRLTNWAAVGRPRCPTVRPNTPVHARPLTSPANKEGRRAAVGTIRRVSWGWARRRTRVLVSRRWRREVRRQACS